MTRGIAASLGSTARAITSARLAKRRRSAGYAADGSVLRIVRTASRLHSADESLADSLLSARASGASDSESMAEYLDVLSKLPVPETLPPYGDVHVDRSGCVWVSDYDPRESADTWAIYDTGGIATARSRIPRSLRIYEIGTNYVLGVETDSLGVEYVTVYRLRRTAS